jgi:hypothetical protein
MVDQKCHAIVKVGIGFESSPQNESHAESAKQVHSECNERRTLKACHSSSTMSRNPRRVHSFRISFSVIQSMNEITPLAGLPDNSADAITAAGSTAIR